MNRKKTPVLILSILAMALLLIASLAGIITDDNGDPYTFTSLRGVDVQVYGGQGIYQKREMTASGRFSFMYFAANVR